LIDRENFSVQVVDLGVGWRRCGLLRLLLHGRLRLLPAAAERHGGCE
jgi:hypothetical protein